MRPYCLSFFFFFWVFLKRSYCESLLYTCTRKDAYIYTHAQNTDIYTKYTHKNRYTNAYKHIRKQTGRQLYIRTHTYTHTSTPPHLTPTHIHIHTNTPYPHTHPPTHPHPDPPHTIPPSSTPHTHTLTSHTHPHTHPHGQTRRHSGCQRRVAASSAWCRGPLSWDTQVLCWPSDAPGHLWPPPAARVCDLTVPVRPD